MFHSTLGKVDGAVEVSAEGLFGHSEGFDDGSFGGLELG